MLYWYCNIVQVNNLAPVFRRSGNTGHKKKRRGSFCFMRRWLHQGIYRYLLTLHLVELVECTLEVPPGHGAVVAEAWRRRAARGGYWRPAAWSLQRWPQQQVLSGRVARTCLWGQAGPGCVSAFVSHSWVRSSYSCYLLVMAKCSACVCLVWVHCALLPLCAGGHTLPLHARPRHPAATHWHVIVMESSVNIKSYTTLSSLDGSNFFW